MRHGGRAPGVLWLPPCKCHRASREHRVQKDDRKALGSIEGTSHRVQRGGSSQLRPPRRIALFNPRPTRHVRGHGAPGHGLPHELGQRLLADGQWSTTWLWRMGGFLVAFGLIVYFLWFLSLRSTSLRERGCA